MKIRRILAGITLCALLLSGCSMRTVEQMYCLPKRSEDYNDLQASIETAMVGLEYCAPLAGEHQQTVHMADLNGDGIQEYLAYTKGTSERPLRILVFREFDQQYVLTDTIESNGTSFDQVEYIQMDDRPGVEIVVGRQISDQLLRSVSVYTLTNSGIEQVLTANYTKFLSVDLDMDERTELMVLHPGQLETDNGVVELYGMENGEAIRYNEVSLSCPADKLKRIVVGPLHDMPMAVYMASAVSDTALITDIYAVVDEKLMNISLSNESGTSVQTMRNYYIYADDINNDGVIELPALINMQQIAKDTSVQRHDVIRWYAMTSTGEEVDKMYTYHNFLGGWYLELDSAWARNFTVQWQSGRYDMFMWDSQFSEPERLLTIYVLTGQNRDEQVRNEGYITLHRTESTTYAATLNDAAAAYGITEENIIRSFHLIHQDWKTGEI